MCIDKLATFMRTNVCVRGYVCMCVDMYRGPFYRSMQIKTRALAK